MLLQTHKVSLFIGRFQPFHNGHLYSLKKAAEIGEKVIVGIGSSQESGTENNPFPYEIRKKMVMNVLGDTGLKAVAIVPIPDFPDDSEWTKAVERIVRDRGYENSDCAVVGNNEWTNGVLSKAGFKVYETGLYNRDELEGVKIREIMRKGKRGWEERVPGVVAEILNMPEMFR